MTGPHQTSGSYDAGTSRSHDAVGRPTSTMPRTALAALVAAEGIAAIAAWRDLACRRDDHVRGSKAFWRLLITMNPGNSVAYWALGRRWHASPDRDSRGRDKHGAGGLG
jgi:hypothetical protein